MFGQLQNMNGPEFGVTVIVNVIGEPPQPLKYGVTVTLAVIAPAYCSWL